MAKNPNREIWETAVWLTNAWQHFASNQQREALEAMPEWHTTLLDSAKSAKVGLDYAHAFLRAQDAERNRSALIAEMQDHLLDQLFNGELVALGFREKPSTSSAPVAIDQDFFDDPEIYWDDNCAAADGKKFNRIRIYDPYALPKGAKPKIGRIGSSDKINAAIDQLIKENPNFGKLPKKTACDQIRKLLKVESASGNGLSNVNLSKYIVSKCGPNRILS